MKLLRRSLIIFLLAASTVYLVLLMVIHFAVPPGKPSGEFVVVNDNWIHYSCRGKGQPVVFFESAFGRDGKTSWDEVSRAVSQQTRTCYYDRLGHGWSSPQPEGFSTDQHVALLADIIHEIAPSQPVILVGHAYGGIIARKYANAYPQHISGLVMVDSSHEEQHSQLSGILQPFSEKDAYIAKLSALTGITKIHNWYKSLSMDDPAAVRMLMRSASVEFADARLNLAREGGLFASLASQGYTLSSVPMIVLEHDPQAYSQEAEWQHANAIWHEMQTEIAALSAKSEHYIVEGSTHNIPKQRPDVVVNAVRKVLENAPELGSTTKSQLKGP